MRAVLPLLILGLWNGGANAQSFLTNAQVFDFQPGDVFQYEYDSWYAMGSYPPWVATDSILSRVDGSGNITYTRKRWTVQYHDFPEPPDVSSGIDTLIVVDLDQPASAWYPMCSPLDSLGPNDQLCGVERWLWMNGADTCELNEWYTYLFYRGCGGPFVLTVSGGGVGNRTDLIYFHKDTLECGDFWNLPTAIDETWSEPAVTIFPNPVDENASVQGFDRKGAIILNALGQRCGQVSNGTNQGLGYLPNGPYWLVGEDAHHRRVRQAFFKL